MRQVHAATKIPGMPYLIHGLKEFPELFVKHSMRI
jgi:hypothetical protein